MYMDFIFLYCLASIFYMKNIFQKKYIWATSSNIDVDISSYYYWHSKQSTKKRKIYYSSFFQFQFGKYFSRMLCSTDIEISYKCKAIWAWTNHPILYRIKHVAAGSVRHNLQFTQNYICGTKKKGTFGYAVHGTLKATAAERCAKL